MNLNEFMREYEAATNSHDFSKVKPLIAENAVYYFSDGTFTDIEVIQKIFEKNWNTIENEIYNIREINWIAESETTVACTYTFYWQGMYKGEYKQGKGRGTNVLCRENGTWKIVHEHLSPWV